MNSERWPHVERLFGETLVREPCERIAFLREACQGDEALFEEVSSLVISHEQVMNFLETPAVQVAAKLLADDQTQSLVGERVGPYEILTSLGAGGMGEVYLAQDPELGRKVALKLLLSRYTRDQELVRRFNHEARAASALNHPNILTIHGIGQDHDRYFIVTEFVDGETLRQHLKATEGARLALSEAMEIAIQVASALEAAHAVGIVHRDIKPENVMLRRDGYVKVLDFGLAKLMEQEPSQIEGAPVEAIFQTEPGMVMGTAAYMSPEQARGLQVDARTDIWSLGCMLYEMVAGHVPFAGPTTSHVMVAVLDEEPPPLVPEPAGEASIEIQRIVTKALRKEKAERYQTIADLLTDLHRLKQQLKEAPDWRATLQTVPTSAQTSIRHIGGATRHTQPSRVQRATANLKYLLSMAGRHRVVMLPVLALLVIVMGNRWGVDKKLAGWVFPPPEQASYFLSPGMIPLTTTGKATIAAISSDGKYFVHVIEEAGQQSLWGGPVNTDGGSTETNQQIVPPHEVVYLGLTFSRDGRDVYYVVTERDHPEGVLYRVPAAGRIAPVKLLVNIKTPVTFSPGDKQMAFVTGRGANGEQALRIANADGSGVQTLATRKYPDFFREPSWSPDGEIIACGAGSYLDGFYMTVIGLRIADQTEIPLTSEKWWSVRRLVWQPDGSGLVMIAMDEVSQTPFQIVRLSYPGGEAQKIISDLHDYRDVSLTRDSSALVTVQSTQVSDFWITPGKDAAARARQITFSKYERVSGVAWTPDGRIVYASRKAGETWNIWSLASDGSDKKLLTVNTGNNLDPAVSADGRYVVFSSTRAGASNIWRMDATGLNPRRLTDGRSEWWPSCSPDSRWVIYTSFASGLPTLWKVSIEGGEPIQLTDRFSMLPTVSPDGKLLACYYSDDLAKFELSIALIPFDGLLPSKTFPAPKGDLLPLQWTADGRALTYINHADGTYNIWNQPIAEGAPRPLTDFKTDRIFNFAWSRDGQRLALSRGVVTNDVVLIQFKRSAS